MITNERQYKITKAEIRRFEAATAEAEDSEPLAGVHPQIHDAMIEGLKSQLDDLKEDAANYEALRAGRIRRRVLTSLTELPLTLIEARIAKRLTQKELARKVGLPEQQIQRYEGTRYAGVGLERLQEVADAVGVRLRKIVDFDPPGAPARGSMKTGAARASRRPTSETGSIRTKAAAGSSSASRRRREPMESVEGGERKVARSGRKTGKAAASAAGKTLRAKSADKTAKRAAASDLAQVGNKKVTSSRAASAAGKTLASKRSSGTAKRAAASDLSQAQRKKRK